MIGKSTHNAHDLRGDEGPVLRGSLGVINKAAAGYIQIEQTQQPLARSGRLSKAGLMDVLLMTAICAV